LDDNKFRCAVGDCPKMFKGEEFVRKHIRNKHGDIVMQSVGDLAYLNSYLKDPFKLTFSGLVHFPNCTFPDRRHRGGPFVRGNIRGSSSYRGRDAGHTGHPYGGRGRGGGSYYDSSRRPHFSAHRDNTRGGRGGGSRFHPYRGRGGFMKGNVASHGGSDSHYVDFDPPRGAASSYSSTGGGNSSLNY
jgi:hypothetical protein